MGRSSIEWLNHLPGYVGRVWQPVTGCEGGCPYCYARRQAKRKLPYGGFTDRDFSEVRTHPERLGEPLHWKKPSIVFVCSMADLFGPQVPDSFIDSVFAVMSLTPKNRYIVLTKQAKRMRQYCSGAGSPEAMRLCHIDDHVRQFNEKTKGMQFSVGPWPLPNLALGVSCPDQQSADRMVPDLLATPAAVRIASIEPMLGAVDLLCAQCGYDRHGYRKPLLTNERLDMVIAGAQSGPGAKDSNLDDFRLLRDQCQAAGVPYFLKQLRIDGKMVSMPKLDGRQWAEYPKTWTK